MAVEASIGKACCVRKYKKGKLDLLDSQQQYENDGKAHPTIVVLQGHDGGTEHAVTVYGSSSWLFDSNVEVHCHSQEKYLIGVYRVNMFVCTQLYVSFCPNPNKKGKNQNKFC